MQLYDSTGTFVAAAVTDDTGAYDFGLVPVGTYYARTFAGLEYNNVLYDGKTCWAGCDVTQGNAISITTAGAPGPIDFALPQASNVISGRITDDTGAPLAGIGVHAMTSTAWIAWATTDANGNYVLRTQDPGAYYVGTSNGAGYRDKIYNDQFCVGSWCTSIGTLVNVVADTPTTGIDFSLPLGSSFRGTVTDATTGLPLQAVSIWIYGSDGQWVGSGYTDQYGRYATTGFPAGTYYAVTWNNRGYIDQLYGGYDCPGSTCTVTNGHAIVLTTATATDGIDFALPQGGTISGTVYRTDTGAGATGINIRIFDASGVLVTTSGTSGSGTYTTTGLRPGTYFAKTFNQAGLKDELFRNVSCPAEQCQVVAAGTSITVAPLADTPGVDFHVSPGGEINGLVIDAQTRAPLASMQIDIFNLAGTRLTSAWTDATGRYRTTGLVGGGYYARAFGQRGYFAQLYSGFACANSNCDVTTGTRIDVTDPEQVTGINFDMLPGGRITATVTDATTTTPLQNVWVQIYTAIDPAGMTTGSVWAQTDASGQATFTGLASGTYYARTQNNGAYFDQLYSGIDCTPWCAPTTPSTPIAVTAGQTVAIAFPLHMGGTISGHVKSTTGALVPGISISLYRQTAPAMVEWVSGIGVDATGAYQFQRLTTGTYFAISGGDANYLTQIYNGLNCTDACAVSSGTPIQVTAGGNTSGIDFTLVQGGKITGQVTTSTGTALPLVNVYLYRSTPTGLQWAKSATTDTSGHYTLPGLDTGTYKAYASPMGTDPYIAQLYNGLNCMTTCDTASGTPIAVTLGDTRANIDFALSLGGGVSGRVVGSDGKPLFPVTVEVYALVAPPTPGMPLTLSVVRTATTDEMGNYTAAGLPAGTYYARTTNAAGYINQIFNGIVCGTFCPVMPGTPITVSLGATTPNVNFTLTMGGTITGKVTTAALTPIANASVQIYQDTGIVGPDRYKWTVSALTDAAGNYTAIGLQTGTYFASVYGGFGATADYVGQMYSGLNCGNNCWPGSISGTPIQVTPALTTSNIDFRLVLAGRISGTVRDAGTGSPLNMAFVSVYSSTGTYVANAMTDATGQFTASGLVPDTYRVSAGTVGYMSQVYNGCNSCSIVTGTPVTVTSGNTTSNVNFALMQYATIAGRVTSRATGAGIASASIRLYSVQRGYFYMSGMTDLNGNYSIGYLDPGTYYVQAYANGFYDQAYNGVECSSGCTSTTGTPIVLTSGATVGNVDFSLQVAPRITGRISDADTLAPIRYASVAIYNDLGGYASSASTDASGNYSSTNLAPGSYYVRANAPGFLEQLYGAPTCPPGCPLVSGTPIVVQAGQTTGSIDLALAHSGIVNGSIRASDGSNLSGVAVEVYDTRGSFSGRVTSDGSGNYSVSSNLVSGNYLLRTINSRGYVDEVWQNQPCLSCAYTSGTPIAVVQGQTVNNIDFVLDRGGAISGHVTVPPDSMSWVSVQVFDSAGTMVTTAWSDQSGNYSTYTGLPTGDYYLRTAGWQYEGFDDVLYAGKPCTLDGCDPLSGTKVTVTAGSTTTGVNFTLTTLGQISGTITDAGTGQQLTSAAVKVYSAAGTVIHATYGSYPGGTYTVKGLPPGTYYVVAYGNGYEQQSYGGVPFPCIDACTMKGTTVTVGAGQRVTGINFQLQRGGQIAGRVMDAATQAGLSPVALEIYDASNVLVSRASTDSSGNYTSASGLPSGSYFVRTRNTIGYVDRLFDAKPCHSCAPSSGTAVTVIEGTTTGGVNLTLPNGARLHGAVLTENRVTNASYFWGLYDEPGIFVTAAPSDGSGNYYSGRYLTVNVFDDAGAYVTSSGVDGSGNYYTHAGLEDGTYYAVTANTAGLIDQAFDGHACPLACDPTLAGTQLTITGGQAAPVNFNLTRGGRISGTIRDAATGIPLSNVWVDFYDSANTWVATGYSTNTGAYISNGGVPTGTYLAVTRAVPGYGSQVHAAITVQAPNTTSGIDFALAPVNTPGAPVVDTSTATSTGGPLAVSAGGTEGQSPEVRVESASGAGTVTVATYASNPGPAFQTGATFFDVYVAPGSTFTELVITTCPAGGASQVVWFNGTSWVPASDQTVLAGPPQCVQVRVNDHTSPALADLTGTYFAAVAGVSKPGITVSTDRGTLWPPNGAFIPVVVTGKITDAGSTIASAAYRVSDDYGELHPAGSVSVAADGSYRFVVMLHAARNGSDLDGRKYTIAVTALDRAGASETKTTTVVVPHDQRKQ